MTDTEQSAMGKHLRDVCKQAREDAGASLIRVAFAHRPEIKQGQTIQQWEDGVIGWPRDTDDRVRAYSEVTGIPARELWQMAIDRWREAQAEDRGEGPSRRPPGAPPKAPPRAPRNSPAKDRKAAGS